MIIKIEAEVSGNFMIEKDMKLKIYPFDIDFRFDSKSNKFFILISKKITDISSIDANNILDEPIKILQLIESFGAIDKGVEKIDWQNYSVEWIPESNEEREDIGIRKSKRDLYYDFDSEILSKDWLNSTVIHRRQIEHLALPFSFYKEGVNFFHSFQYQNSFLNFYLMIEGFFGNGEFKNKLVKIEFKKSQILEKAINQTLSFLIQKKSIHYDWLNNVCKKYNKNVDKDGIIHFLVEFRGHLSHFSLKNSDKMKNIFKDKDYESLAFISMCICRFASIDLRLSPFKK